MHFHRSASLIGMAVRAPVDFHRCYDALSIKCERVYKNQKGKKLLKATSKRRYPQTHFWWSIVRKKSMKPQERHPTVQQENMTMISLWKELCGSLKPRPLPTSPREKRPCLSHAVRMQMMTVCWFFSLIFHLFILYQPLFAIEILEPRRHV